MKLMFIKDWFDSNNNLIFKIGDIKECQHNSSLDESNFFYIPMKEIKSIDLRTNKVIGYKDTFIFSDEEFNIYFVILSDYRNFKIDDILK